MNEHSSFLLLRLQLKGRSMNGHFESIVAIIFGGWLLLFNKQLGELTNQYGKAVTGVPSSTWPSRIGFIVVGAIFIACGIVSW